MLSPKHSNPSLMLIVMFVEENQHLVDDTCFMLCWILFISSQLNMVQGPLKLFILDSGTHILILAKFRFIYMAHLIIDIVTKQVYKTPDVN